MAMAMAMAMAVAMAMIKCHLCKRSYFKKDDKIRKCSRFQADAELEGIDRPTNYRHMKFLLNRDCEIVSKDWRGQGCAGFKQINIYKEKQ